MKTVLVRICLDSNSKSVSSVGATWPLYHDVPNERRKGFFPHRLDTEHTHERLIRGIREAAENYPNATRTTVRALVGKSMLEAVSNNGLGTVEAIVNIANIDVNYDLVYFGQNHPARRAPLEVRVREQESIQRIITEIQPVSEEAAMARLRDGKYSIVPIQNPGPALIEQLLHLYQATYEHYTFPITPENISIMAAPPNILLVAFASDGQVAGALVAEKAQVKIDGDTLTLYELSDYATHREHRGAGIMTAMQIHAIRYLRNLPGGREFVIYSENRAPWEPVSISSQKTGLMTYSGTLEQQCKLLSDRTPSIGVQADVLYEDLHVFTANGY